MGRIVSGMFISLDGIVETPEKWTGPYFSDEIGQEIGTQMGQSEAMLLGRKTYETFAASFADQSGGMADQMNAIPKIVVSTTLNDAGWANSRLVHDLDEIGRLKKETKGNLGMSGSATLVASLLRHGLLDELRLLVFPVVIGSGQRLFPDQHPSLALRLEDATRFANDVVRLVYQPA